MQQSIFNATGSNAESNLAKKRAKISQLEVQLEAARNATNTARNEASAAPASTSNEANQRVVELQKAEQRIRIQLTMLRAMAQDLQKNIAESSNTTATPQATAR